jgi:hypothetical protein
MGSGVMVQITPGPKIQSLSPVALNKIVTHLLICHYLRFQGGELGQKKIVGRSFLFSAG